MKHQIHTGNKLGRSAPQRNAMLKTMITQVIQHERIQTTQAKAKYVRSDLEKLITLAKHGLTASETDTPNGTARFVNARRLAAGRLNDPEMVPLDIGVHIKLPLYLHADSERLNAKPVRAVYDWLSDLFNVRNPWFGPDLSLGTSTKISGALAQIYSGTPFSAEPDQE